MRWLPLLLLLAGCATPRPASHVATVREQFLRPEGGPQVKHVFWPDGRYSGTGWDGRVEPWGLGTIPPWASPRWETGVDPWPAR